MHFTGPYRVPANHLLLLPPWHTIQGKFVHATYTRSSLMTSFHTIVLVFPVKSYIPMALKKASLGEKTGGL